MIKQSIQSELITAMKAKDTEKTQTLRYILAQIKNKEIEKRTELTDEEVTDTLRKEAKKLQESIDSFTAGGRSDLGDESQVQLDILSTYLPKELGDEELAAKVQIIIDANNELFQKNPVALIGLCIKELKSEADSSRIAAAVKKHM
ncbi:MAG: GatB/YqeY domain-containing protein [bacterium]|nr:GatB/YqeY domain-containing protein [bacterium]